MDRNTAVLWDRFWKLTAIPKQDIYMLKVAENSILWRRIKKVVLSNFNSLNKLKVIEIGAGRGTFGALMAKNGADVTILDYSKKAIEKSNSFFKNNNLSAKYLCSDIFNLKKSLLGYHDISMSFGLAEHFKGNNRIYAIKSHLDLVKKNGLIFISVPNKFNFPYRFYKFITEATGVWPAGEEYPFSRGELSKICKAIGVKNYGFLGEALYRSVDFVVPRSYINPVKITRKIMKTVFGMKFDSLDMIKPEMGTCLDEYLSFALVLYGKKF